MAFSTLARRVLGAVLALVVVAAGVGAFLINRALSPGTFRPIAESQLTKVLGMRVSVGRLDIDLFPRPQVTGGEITIGDAGGQHAPSLRLGGVRIRPRFSTLLSGRPTIDLIEIQGLALAVRRDAEGRWHLPFEGAATAAASQDRPAASTNQPARPEKGAPVEIGEIRLAGGSLTIIDDVLPGPSKSAEAATVRDVAALVHATGDTIQLTALQARLGSSTLTGSGEMTRAGLHFTLAWGALKASDLSELFGLAGTAPIAGLMVDSERPLDLDVSVQPEGRLAAKGTVRADRIAAGSTVVTGVSVPFAYDGTKATAALKAERLALGTLTLTSVESDLTFDGTRLTADPVTFVTCGGRARGRFTYVPARPGAWTLIGAVDGIDVNAFLSANTSARDRLSGTGRLDVDVRGATEGPLEESLAGTVRAVVTNGVIRNFALLAAINRALGITGGGGKDMTFDAMSGTLAIGGAQVSTRDLILRMGELTVTAEGTLGFDQTINVKGRGNFSRGKTAELTAHAKTLRLLANARGELEFPVRVSGTVAAPRFTIDLSRVGKTAATNVIKKELGKALNRLIRK